MEFNKSSSIKQRLESQKSSDYNRRKFYTYGSGGNILRIYLLGIIKEYE